jgi:hypothetical protein
MTATTTVSWGLTYRQKNNSHKILNENLNMAVKIQKNFGKVGNQN